MWYLTLASIIICILYVILNRIYLRKKWRDSKIQNETHLSIKTELGTWDENRKVFLNMGAMIAMACILMAADMPYKIPDIIPEVYDDEIDDHIMIPISIYEPPPPEAPKPEPEPEVKPPPVLVIYKPIEKPIPPPEPKPVIVTKEPAPFINPIAKPKVIPKKTKKPEPKPLEPPPPPKPPEVYEHFMVEVKPEFPGGENALREYILKNVKYSASCREREIEGKVFVRFVIGASGRIKKAELVKGLNCGVDENAVDVIKKMPDWSPGMQQNTAVDVQMIVPIDFRLE